MSVKKVDLFLNSASDYSIVDGYGHNVSLEEARVICESGRLGNYNLAFLRLRDANFDLAAVKAQYTRGALPPLYHPDCPACLRGRIHTNLEHEAGIRRAQGSSL